MNGESPAISKKLLMLWMLAVPLFVNSRCADITNLCKKDAPTDPSRNSIKAGSASILSFLASQCRSVERGVPLLPAKARTLTLCLFSLNSDKILAVSDRSHILFWLAASSFSLYVVFKARSGMWLEISKLALT